MTIQKSPIMSYNIVADVKNICSLCNFDENVHSDRADDECHLVEVRNFEVSGETHQYALFKLPADAIRDS